MSEGDPEISELEITESNLIESEALAPQEILTPVDETSQLPNVENLYIMVNGQLIQLPARTDFQPVLSAHRTAYRMQHGQLR